MGLAIVTNGDFLSQRRGPLPKLLWTDLLTCVKVALRNGLRHWAARRHYNQFVLMMMMIMMKWTNILLAHWTAIMNLEVLLPQVLQHVTPTAIASVIGYLCFNLCFDTAVSMINASNPDGCLVSLTRDVYQRYRISDVAVD